MIPIDEASRTGIETLALGTPEAAVRSCVSLMAAVTGQPEKYLTYWLDLYYQVRRAYEKSNRMPPLTPEEQESLLANFREELKPSRARPLTPEDRLHIETPRAEAKADEAPPPKVTGAGKAWRSGPSPTAKFKQKIFDRIRTARAKGMTYAQIASMGDGITENTIIMALNAEKVSMACWHEIKRALDRIEAGDGAASEPIVPG